LNLEETNIFTQKGFLDFYKSKQFSDVVIVLMSGKEYFCHKLLLANCSEYFYKLFVRKQMKEKKLTKQKKINEKSQSTLIGEGQASNNQPTTASSTNKHSETLTIVNEEKTYESSNLTKLISRTAQWKKANIASTRQNQIVESSLKPTNLSLPGITNFPQHKKPLETTTTTTTTTTIYETNSITTQTLHRQMNSSNQKQEQEQINQDNRRHEKIRGIYRLNSLFINLF
jgi:hypothetical protein